jgi:hypothetical protein
MESKATAMGCSGANSTAGGEDAKEPAVEVPLAVLVPDETKTAVLPEVSTPEPVGKLPPPTDTDEAAVGGPKVASGTTASSGMAAKKPSPARATTT